MMAYNIDEANMVNIGEATNLGRQNVPQFIDGVYNNNSNVLM